MRCVQKKNQIKKKRLRPASIDKTRVDRRITSIPSEFYRVFFCYRVFLRYNTSQSERDVAKENSILIEK